MQNIGKSLLIGMCNNDERLYFILINEWESKLPKNAINISNDQIFKINRIPLKHAQIFS